MSDTPAFAPEFVETARDLLARLDLTAIAAVSELLYRAKEEGRRIFFFGNGGSHSIATHLAADL